MSTNTDKVKSLNVGDFDSSYYSSKKKSNSILKLSSSNSVKGATGKKGVKGPTGKKSRRVSITTDNSVTSVTDGNGTYTNGNGSGNQSLAIGQSLFNNSGGTFNINDYNSHLFFDGGRLDWNDLTVPNYPNHRIEYMPTLTTTSNLNLIITFMENQVKFFQLPGFEKSDLKIQVVKNQVQIRAERKPIKSYDPDNLDTVVLEDGFQFDEETYDAKAVSVSFLNGLLRIEVPLLKDIVSEVAIS